MTLDLERLLQPTVDEPPCGPDLEYDPERQQLEAMQVGREEQVWGDVRIAAVQPDWPRIAPLAIEQLVRSKDLRVATMLVRALTAQNGIEGCVAGLELIYQLLLRYWKHVHPLPDEDGAWARAAALHPLGAKTALPLELASAMASQRAVPVPSAAAPRALVRLCDAIERLWRAKAGDAPLDLSALLPASAGRPERTPGADAELVVATPIDRIEADSAGALAALQQSLHWWDQLSGSRSAAVATYKLFDEPVAKTGSQRDRNKMRSRPRDEPSNGSD